MARRLELPPSDSEPEGNSEREQAPSSEPASKHRSAFLRAMSDKPWVGAANMGPKRKAEESGIGEPSLDTEEVEPKPKKPKKDRNSKAAKKDKPATKSASKTTNKGKQPATHSRAPSRRLQLDDSSNDEEPLPPKPVIVPTMRTKANGKSKLAHDDDSKPATVLDTFKLGDDDKSESGASDDGSNFSPGSNSEGSEDDNEDLQRLVENEEALAKSLDAERAQWATPEGRAINQTKSQYRQSNNKNKVSESADTTSQPNISSLASQVASSLSQSATGNSTGGYSLEVLERVLQEALEYDRVNRLRSASETAVESSRSHPEPVKTKAKSQRELALEQERPQFAAPSTTKASIKTTPKAPKTPSDRGRTREKREENWPVNTRLKYSSKGKVHKMAQSETIEAYIDGVIEDIAKDAAFHKGIYPIEDRFNAQRKVITETARRLGLVSIKDRVREDEAFAKHIIGQGEHRLTLNRGEMKKRTTPHIAGAFGLDSEKTEETQVRVTELLEELKFAYPLQDDGAPDPSKPFDTKLIAQVIGDAFFDGQESLAARNPSLFAPTLENVSDEKEMPEPMIAMACAVIHLSLTDWSSGSYKYAKFSLSEAEKPYKAAIAVLEKVYDRSPQQYHRITHAVYKNVRKYCNGIGNVEQEKAVASAVAFVKIDE